MGTLGFWAHALLTARPDFVVDADGAAVALLASSPQSVVDAEGGTLAFLARVFVPVVVTDATAATLSAKMFLLSMRTLGNFAWLAPALLASQLLLPVYADASAATFKASTFLLPMRALFGLWSWLAFGLLYLLGSLLRLASRRGRRRLARRRGRWGLFLHPLRRWPAFHRLPTSSIVHSRKASKHLSVFGTG